MNIIGVHMYVIFSGGLFKKNKTGSALTINWNTRLEHREGRDFFYLKFIPAH